MAGTKEVKFFNDGVYYASITIEVSEDGKKKLIPSPGYSLFPMDIDGADAEMYSYDPDLIVYPKVGDKRRRSYIVPVKEEAGSSMMRDDWAENKREERLHRCLIPGKDGRPIVCRGRSCYGCENACMKESSGRLVSLDAMQENSHWDPALEGDDSRNPETIVMEDEIEKEFCKYLAGIQEKLMVIYQMDRDGYSVADICKVLGIECERTVYKDRKRIERLREQFAKQYI